MKNYMKIVYGIIAILLVATSVSFAQAKKATPVRDWQTIDVGPAENYGYAFDANGIKYAKNADGSLDKNIIIYEEKKTNLISMSTEFNYYTITKCQLNIQAQSICFGDESFYTKKDKFRWTDTPTFLTWIAVKPESIGAKRFSAIVNYVQAHDAEITARS